MLNETQKSSYFVRRSDLDYNITFTRYELC